MSKFTFSRMTKRYGGTTALDNVSLDLSGGRIHALVGENGAGKSTLIKLLAGVVQADSLSVSIDGTTVSLNSASDAHAAGFRFIHQEHDIVPQITVAENILLGRDLPRRFGFAVDWRELQSLARKAIEVLGAEGIDLNAMAGDLPPDDQMAVRIAAALVAEPGRDARLYVLDEPTAALTGEESEKLFAVLGRLRSRGAAVLYVSHRINEVMRICDDVTVLRDGRHVTTCPVAETSESGIISAMTGLEVADVYPPPQDAPGTDIVARVRGDTQRLRDLDFEIRAGEILGVAGLAGAGMTDLTRLFLGMDRMKRGHAELLGGGLPASPSEAWKRGVAHIPRERRYEGLMLDLPVRSNIVLPHLKGLWADRASETADAVEMGASVHLKSEGPEQPVGQLSGGNQQKCIFARALMGRPRLLLLEDPTRGVDVGAKLEIYQLARNLSAKGCAVMLASSDMPEVLGMSDQILVLGNHRQTHLVDSDMAPADLVARFYEDGPEGLGA